MTPEEVVSRHLHASIETKHRLLDECLGDILAAGALLAETIREGNKVLFCGNGGSAADSQHFATELVVRLRQRFREVLLEEISHTVSSKAEVEDEVRQLLSALEPGS